MTKVLTEPFKIKMVEPLKVTTKEYRKHALEIANYNPFLLKAEDVFIDLLTDSGTGAMSDRQWAAMMLGDESYAGSKSWQQLETVVHDLTGMPYILPTHQGRAAERILYSILGGPGKIFLSNTHFDTTRANIEFSGATAIDVMPEDALDPTLDLPFKGNIDLKKTEELIIHYGTENIAAIILTVTNNSSGGQPVSMENLHGLRALCDTYNILLVLDGCRIAENSYFIKHREPNYSHLSYYEIAQYMLSKCDAFVMSAKKDGLVNIGGLLTLRNAELADECKNLLIISEGFTSYGGLAGRDLAALAVGLQEVFEPDYLEYRIRSTTYLGEGLRNLGIPVMWPIGGHAVYCDAHAFYPDIPIHQYPGQMLVCNAYLEGGIRCCEVGSVMFGKYDVHGQLIPAKNELVRLAIPRRVYTQSHIDYTIEIFEQLVKNEKPKQGLHIIFETKLLRHFTAKFQTIIPTIN